MTTATEQKWELQTSDTECQECGQTIFAGEDACLTTAEDSELPMKICAECADARKAAAI